MTPIEAFNVLVQIACLAPITHRDHVAMMQAIEVLRKVIEPPKDDVKDE